MNSINLIAKLKLDPPEFECAGPVESGSLIVDASIAPRAFKIPINADWHLIDHLDGQIVAVSGWVDSDHAGRIVVRVEQVRPLSSLSAAAA